MIAKNVFKDIPDSIPEELLEEIIQTETFRVERILSHGQCSPPGFWYDQTENEWVLLLRGSAGLRFAEDSSESVLNPGDYLQIPAHTRHRIEWTDPDQPTVWLTIHYA